MKIIGNRVFLKDIKAIAKQEGLIVVPEQFEKIKTAVVHDCGPECKIVKKDDSVVFMMPVGIPISIGDVDYLVVRENDLFFVRD
jgi:co-chaperonin GroES (HSP10)